MKRRKPNPHLKLVSRKNVSRIALRDNFEKIIKTQVKYPELMNEFLSKLSAGKGATSIKVINDDGDFFEYCPRGNDCSINYEFISYECDKGICYNRGHSAKLKFHDFKQYELKKLIKAETDNYALSRKNPLNEFIEKYKIINKTSQFYKEFDIVHNRNIRLINKKEDLINPESIYVYAEKSISNKILYDIFYEVYKFGQISRSSKKKLFDNNCVINLQEISNSKIYIKKNNIDVYDFSFGYSTDNEKKIIKFYYELKSNDNPSVIITLNIPFSFGLDNAIAAFLNLLGKNEYVKSKQTKLRIEPNIKLSKRYTLQFKFFVHSEEFYSKRSTLQGALPSPTIEYQASKHSCLENGFLIGTSHIFYPLEKLVIDNILNLKSDFKPLIRFFNFTTKIDLIKYYFSCKLLEKIYNVEFIYTFCKYEQKAFLEKITKKMQLIKTKIKKIKMQYDPLSLIDKFVEMLNSHDNFRLENDLGDYCEFFINPKNDKSTYIIIIEVIIPDFSNQFTIAAKWEFRFSSHITRERIISLLNKFLIKIKTSQDHYIHEDNLSLIYSNKEQDFFRKENKVEYLKLIGSNNVSEYVKNGLSVVSSIDVPYHNVRMAFSDIIKLGDLKNDTKVSLIDSGIVGSFSDSDTTEYQLYKNKFDSNPKTKKLSFIPGINGEKNQVITFLDGIDFCKERKLSFPAECTKQIIELYIDINTEFYREKELKFFKKYSLRTVYEHYIYQMN